MESTVGFPKIGFDPESQAARIVVRISPPSLQANFIGHTTRCSPGAEPVSGARGVGELGHGRFGQPFKVGVPDAHGVGMSASPEDYPLILG